MDTILSTPITWSMIEADLKKALSTSAIFGSAKKAEAFGKGCSFLSKTVLLTFDWQGCGSQELPETALLKVCQRQPQEERGTDIFDSSLLNDNELLLYTETVKALPPNFPIPRYYCGRLYSKELEAGYVLIEFVANASLCHLVHNVQFDGVLEVVGWLAEMAVYSIKNPEKLALAKTVDANDECLKDFTRLEISLARYDKMEAHFPDLKEDIDYFRVKTREVLKDFDTLQTLRDKISNVKLICHGDPWPPNLLWKRGANGNFHVFKFVDWQLFHIGTPCWDLTLFLFGCMAPEDYDRIPDAIRHYYDLITARVGYKNPWDNVEQLLTEFEKIFAWLILMLLPMNVGMLGSCMEALNEVDEGRIAEYGRLLDAKMRRLSEETKKYLLKWY
ncbi:unnamed protein product, partial [Mesorhabditis spiculigera]